MKYADKNLLIQVKESEYAYNINNTKLTYKECIFNDVTVMT